MGSPRSERSPLHSLASDFNTQQGNLSTLGSLHQWGSYLKSWHKILAQVLRAASDVTWEKLILGQAAQQAQINWPKTVYTATLPISPSHWVRAGALGWASG